jgi:S1-C subfamily serine protease
LILNVEPGSPAAQAGLREGDIAVKYNDHALTSIDELQRQLTWSEINRRSVLEVVRHTFRLELTVTPTEAPV